ncbi:hypothetical protein B0H12DRAFT_1332183 [Mycena haematopus]|nr:hypothetical protein B0H12DRAFT_1332183 [Mycena haematopus]
MSPPPTLVGFFPPIAPGVMQKKLDLSAGDLGCRSSLHQCLSLCHRPDLRSVLPAPASTTPRGRRGRSTHARRRRLYTARRLRLDSQDAHTEDEDVHLTRSTPRASASTCMGIRLRPTEARTPVIRVIRVDNPPEDTADDTGPKRREYTHLTPHSSPPPRRYPTPLDDDPQLGAEEEGGGGAFTHSSCRDIRKCIPYPQSSYRDLHPQPHPAEDAADARAYDSGLKSTV